MQEAGLHRIELGTFRLNSHSSGVGVLSLGHAQLISRPWGQVSLATHLPTPFGQHRFQRHTCHTLTSCPCKTRLYSLALGPSAF
jgi:hypothetical protein